MSSNVQNCPLEATFKITPEIAARDHVLGMALAPNEARRSIPAKFSACQQVFERGHFPTEEDNLSWWECLRGVRGVAQGRAADDDSSAQSMAL